VYEDNIFIHLSFKYLAMLVKKGSALNDSGIEVFTFGKYRNKSVLWVLQSFPEYMIWLLKNTNYVFSNKIHNEIKRLKL